MIYNSLPYPETKTSNSLNIRARCEGYNTSSKKADIKVYVMVTSENKNNVTISTSDLVLVDEKNNIYLPETWTQATSFPAESLVMPPADPKIRSPLSIAIFPESKQDSEITIIPKQMGYIFLAYSGVAAEKLQFELREHKPTKIIFSMGCWPHKVHHM
jgi:hypothetical protein